MKRSLIASITLFLGLWLNGAHAAIFKAEVDRHQLSQQEGVMLTLSLINSELRLRAEGVDPTVDLSVLSRDFDLGVPKADFRYNIYQGRGRSTSEIKVKLFPRHSGRLTIPAFEADGTHTQAITLEVKPVSEADAPEVFIRKGSNAGTLWVGQQLVAYVDLYHRVELKEAARTDILETEPKRIETLANWHLPQARFTAEHKGFKYDVERLAWSIFPDAAGPMTVYLPALEVTTAEGRQLRMPHQRIDVEVKALPAGIPADIIIGEPQVENTPPPIKGKQHELLQWSVSIKAPVAILTLPDFLPMNPLPEGLKLYADRAHRDSFQANSGVADAAEYVFSIMPLKAGDFELPAVNIPYFDVVKGEAKLIELPGQKISIAAAPAPAQANLNIPATTTDDSVDNSAIQINPWPWSTALFALLWIVTLVAWQRRSKPSNRPEKQITPVPTPVVADHHHPLQAQLLNAFGTRTLEEGLMRFKDETQLINTVRAVQKLCYSPTGESDTSLTEEVNNAVQKIRATRQHAQKTDENDPWQPESFTRSV